MSTTNVLEKKLEMSTLGKLPLRLQVIDYGDLPAKPPPTQEEIENDPLLKLLLNGPIATDEQIQAIEDGGRELHGVRDL